MPTAVVSGIRFRLSAEDRTLLHGRRWRVKKYQRGQRTLAYLVDLETRERFHRLILGLQQGDPRLADHIDGDTTNNCRENLRIVGALGNAHNSSPWGISGYKGVYPHQGAWRCLVRTGKKSLLRLGTFTTQQEAALAYDQYCRKFRPFARLNFPSVSEYPQRRLRTKSLALTRRPTYPESGYRGVVKKGNRWKAQIKYGGVNHYLGSFSSGEAAARAFDLASLRRYGSDAVLNFSPPSKQRRTRRIR